MNKKFLNRLIEMRNLMIRMSILYAVDLKAVGTFNVIVVYACGLRASFAQHTDSHSIQWRI